MVLDFFLNAFVLKYFVVFFVLCANGCIVCVQKLPDLLTRILVFNVFLLQKEAHASNTIAAHQQN